MSTRDQFAAWMNGSYPSPFAPGCEGGQEDPDVSGSAAEDLEKAKAELAAVKRETELRALREQISRETGVPVSLLDGDTEADCRAQAAAIRAYAANAADPGYPSIKDGGEIPVPLSKHTRFSEWLDNAIGLWPKR